ncbi:hypothetical protein [Jiangella sp. DSM 45060]|uniref:hypothetical protein n=1 Tax=Jiangella sp. DSM 45060 TaxID=1798224 RepID=UPI0012FDC4D2|nr:hypothetical protein [Jiangella sp. DSM 45060]
MSDSTQHPALAEGSEQPTWWLLRRAVAGDNEAAAAVVILCDRVFVDDQRAWSHVDDRREAIDWAGILAEGTWSSGERALLALGRNLWSGGDDTAVDVTDLIRLGDGYFAVAMEAIAARRGVGPVAGGFVSRARSDRS